MAEVLITLAIIGVVAALTMPVVIQKYQSIVLMNQLKKSYSTISNALKLAMADKEVTRISETELYKACVGTPRGMHGSQFPDPEKCTPVLKKYINILNYSGTIGRGDAVGPSLITDDRVYGSDISPEFRVSIMDFAPCGDRSCNSAMLFTTANGMDMYLSFEEYYRNIPGVYAVIDVNGYGKGPNRIGKDLFSFVLDDSAKAIFRLPESELEEVKNNVEEYLDIELNDEQHFTLNSIFMVGEPSFYFYSAMQSGWDPNYNKLDTEFLKKLADLIGS